MTPEGVGLGSLSISRFLLASGHDLLQGDDLIY